MGNERLLREAHVRIDPMLAQTAAEWGEAARTVVWFSDAREAIAVLAIADRIKPTSVEAIAEMHRMGVEVHMLTGDNAATAAAIALQTGIVRHQASMLPEDKAAAVRRMQDQGHRVLMVGDGLNDAGALAQADVGVTVTETSAALTPASDAIMDAAALHRLPGFLALSRKARRIVIASLCISLCYNVTGVSVAVAGYMTPLYAAILMPLSSVSVVGFVTVGAWWAARRTIG